MPEVHLVGEIQGAEYLPKDTAATFCRYRLVTGPGWTVLDGTQSGQTQAAEIDYSGDYAGQDGGRAVWSHPFDVHLAATCVTGWPQLAVTVWGQDSLSRNEIVGYGVVHVPPSPGVHVVEVPTWRPLGNAVQELSAWFLGGVPHLADTSLVVDPADRHKIGTVTSALVTIELHVLVKGFAQHGVAMLDA